MEISYPSTASIGGKKHMFHVVEDSMDYAWSYFLKEKSELKDLMMTLFKDSKMMFGVTVRYAHCDNAGENETLE